MNGWRSELLGLAVLASVAAVAGWVSGRPGLAFAVAMLIYLGWHALQYTRFRRHRSHGTLQPPFPPGVWHDICAALAASEADSAKARKKLNRFDARFRRAAAIFPDALAVLSKRHLLRWCNPVAEAQLFGQTLADISGQKIGELLPDGRLATYLSEGDFSEPLTLSPAHDRRLVLNIRVMPFGRRKHQLLVIASDITRIHHLDAARRDFVANLSHELRTPLTVITGYLEMLGEHLSAEPDWSPSLVLMNQQAARMRAMLDELTLLSRLESEEKPPQVETVDVSTLIERIVNEARALDDSSWRQIETDTDRSLLLDGDPLELHSAFSNLIFNAIRHTPPGTGIQVGWRRLADGGAAMSVKDDGPGIDPDHLPRLTERFYRIDRARSRESGGTGLGLAIVKHVMNRHDGRLVIQSQPGEGSLFECRFGPDRVAAGQRITHGEA